MPSVKTITSLRNPSVKKVVSLREHKERNKTGLMIIEGVREITLALKAGVEFTEIYVCERMLNSQVQREILRLLSEKGIGCSLSPFPVNEVNEKVFAKMAFGQRAEGILAVGRQPRMSFDKLKFKEIPLLVVIERIEKPGNLGAILRSCDGAGIDGLIVCDGRTDVYNPNAVRASIGTIFSVPVVQSDNKEAVDFLKKNRIKIFTASPNAQRLYCQVDFRGPSALVLGSEEVGLSDFWKKYGDEPIKLPMLGAADSLNVSATAAILIYEALRQREKL